MTIDIEARLQWRIKRFVQLQLLVILLSLLSLCAMLCANMLATMSTGEISTGITYCYRASWRLMIAYMELERALWLVSICWLFCCCLQMGPMGTCQWLLLSRRSVWRQWQLLALPGCSTAVNAMFCWLRSIWRKARSMNLKLLPQSRLWRNCFLCLASDFFLCMIVVTSYLMFLMPLCASALFSLFGPLIGACSLFFRVLQHVFSHIKNAWYCGLWGSCLRVGWTSLVVRSLMACWQESSHSQLCGSYISDFIQVERSSLLYRRRSRKLALILLLLFQCILASYLVLEPFLTPPVSRVWLVFMAPYALFKLAILVLQLSGVRTAFLQSGIV